MLVSFSAARRHRLPVHDRSQGLHPERGYRADQRLGRDRAGHRLSDLQVQHMQDIMRILQQDPNVAAFTADAGGGRLNIDLKPRARAERSAPIRSSRAAPEAERVHGRARDARRTRRRSASAACGRGAGAYQFTLQDTDTDELYRVAPDFDTALRQLPGIEDVTTDLQLKNPQVSVDLDRDQIAALGLTVNQVETALSNAYSRHPGVADLRAQQPVSGDPAGAPRVQKDPAALSMLYVAGHQPATWCRSPPSSRRARRSARWRSTTPASCRRSPIRSTSSPGVALGDAVAQRAGARAARRCRRRSRPRSRARRRRSRIRCRARLDSRAGDRRHLHRPRASSTRASPIR